MHELYLPSNIPTNICWLLYILVYVDIHCHMIVESGMFIAMLIIVYISIIYHTLSYDCKESGMFIAMLIIVCISIICHTLSYDCKESGMFIAMLIIVYISIFVMPLSNDCTIWDISSINNKECELMRAFNIFQVYQYFTIYRQNFLYFAR
jgi:hypothetical protein